MGEYATRKSDGQNVKIGTCESMYYLRFDQRGDVDYPWPALSSDVEKLDPFLYRFPDPKEDGILPGEYESSWGGVDLSLPGFWQAFPEGSVDHGSMQFTDTRKHGYLLNMPCPEAHEYNGPYGKAPQLHRNGGTTTVTINAQRWYGGRLVLVVECAGCSRSIRLPELSDATPILEALERNAKAQVREAECYYGSRDTTPEELEQIRGNMRKQAQYWIEVANRIIAGYKQAA